MDDDTTQEGAFDRWWRAKSAPANVPPTNPFDDPGSEWPIVYDSWVTSLPSDAESAPVVSRSA